MGKLEVLRNLVDISEEELAKIYDNIDKKPDSIQLLDYVDYLNLDEKQIDKLKDLPSISKERQQKIEKYKKAILGARTLNQILTTTRINPYTEFENEPKLFFGVGGGSKELCKGLPFDVLIMILTGEKIRRDLNIKKCYILLANRITYTNIPRNTEFSKESIDNVMYTEKKILELVLKRFKFDNHWEVIMQTDLDKFLSEKDYKKYEELIKLADESNLVGGHHYSIEMADIFSMVGNYSGGIKLGWFIRNIDSINGGYIMDEQPFHARYVLFCAKEGIKNKVSLAYALAGTRIYSGSTGQLEKSSPYICYFPENRILLSPYENIVKKMKKATLSGYGFEYKYVRNFFGGIIDLFDKLVLEDSSYEIKKNNDFRCSEMAEKMQYILDYIFKDNTDEMKDVWLQGFNYKGEDYL